MNLYIGKNHLGDTSPVQSIFRLVGSDEDALTFALGFLLAHDHSFCTELVRHLRIAPRQTLESVYSVHLQEVTGSGFGRRDIVCQGRRDIRPCGGVKVYHRDVGAQHECHHAAGVRRIR